MGDSIQKQMVSGIFFTAIAKYSNVIISLIVTAILSRILSPGDFGVVAVATVIIAFFGMFTEIGIAPAIIQNKTLTEDDLSSIFSFTVWSGLLLSLLFIACAAPIANYYKSPILQPICYYLSINLFFSSCQIVPNGLLYKDKNFKFIAVRSFLVQLISGALAIISVFLNFGIYSLLINPILSSFLLFIISYFKKPIKFRFRFQVNALKKIFSFSFFQFLFNLINYFSRNLDKLIIGKYLNMNALGYYEKSYRLMMLPLQTITQVVSPVMHPIFSEFQNDYKKLSDSYLKVVKLLAYIGFPLSILLFFTSKELVLLVFGMQWTKSITCFRILSLSVGFEIILSTSGSIFQASNSTKTLFLCGLLSTLIDIFAILIGVFVYQKIEVVALALLFAFIINFFISFILMFYRVFNNSILSFFRVLLLPVCLSLILMFVLYLVNFLLIEVNLFVTLIIKTIIVLTISILFIHIFKVYDMKLMFKNIIGKKYRANN
jgi:O-antigen/teichoic acid export membrane protein